MATEQFLRNIVALSDRHDNFIKQRLGPAEMYWNRNQFIHLWLLQFFIVDIKLEPSFKFELFN